MKIIKRTSLVAKAIGIIVGILLIFIVSSIITKPVQANNAGTSWNGNMPSFGYFNPTTGLFPQIYKSRRTVTLPEERFLTETESWKVDYSTGLVLCAKEGNTLRNGNRDETIYYPLDQHADIFKNLATKMREEAENLKWKVESGWNDATFRVSWSPEPHAASVQYYNTNASEMYSHVVYGSYANAGLQEILADMMRKKYDELPGIEKSEPVEDDSINGADDKMTELSAKFGPEVTIMKDAGDNKGYNMNGPTKAYESTGDRKSNQYAYVLTAVENTYKDPYNGKYDDEDLQSAYWLIAGDGNVSHEHKITANGRELYEMSIKYANFCEYLKSTGYVTTMKTDQAQIHVLQDTKQYIVGPFYLDYYDEPNISYIKEIYITDKNGNKLVDTKNIEVVFQSMNTEVLDTGRSYPRKNEGFYVKFSADEAGYPTEVYVNAAMEYISNAKINYKELSSEAEVWQYIGYYATDDSGIKKAVVRFTGHYSVDKEVVNPPWYHHPPEDWENGGCPGHDGGTSWVHLTDGDVDKTITFYLPYIQQEYQANKVAQPLTEVLDGEREYKVVKAVGKAVGEFGTSVPPADNEKTPIDLTIHLGGTVWVDNLGGKETVGDANFGSGDTPMANVEVTIHNQDGSLAKTSTPNPVKTDSNGNYVFKGLNAMYKYYITFKYNAQYYEPVTYANPKSTINSSNWGTNSNGTDLREDRLNMNTRFATIGATPANYSGLAGTNRTYTRDELKAAGAIDDFGNPTGRGDSSMQQFIKDCQLESYTGINGTKDVYPIYDRFVVDDKEVNQLLKRLDILYAIVDHSQIPPLYPTHDHINQGYNLRQEVDLALKKDVEKATLEINGKTHVYQYNQRENVSDDEYERTWDIEARISDAYYDTRYSRELFKSDYAYKIGNYGEDPGQYGKDLDDELKVFITYKLTLRNQSMSIQGRINEIVDYFDEDYTFVPNRSSIYTQVGDVRTIIHANKQDGSSIFKENETIYSGGKATIQGYKNLYITGLGAGTRATERTYYYENGQQKWRDKEVDLNDGVYLKSGQTAYVYLTFEVNKKDNWLILDETVDQAATPIGVGKENIAEINGFSTRYAGGTQVANVGDVGGLAAGLIDRDSNPGNVEYTGIKKDMSDNEAKEVYKKFEDDTDKAPNLRIILYKDDAENRVINGAVWEDERNKVNGAATVGDGIRNNETPINGVTVQLVELMDNGTEFVWRTFENGSGTANSTTPIININGLVKDYTIGEMGTGKYAFKSFMPGNYIVRYIYGDTLKTVLVNDTSSSDEAKNISNVYGQKGLNAKSYNGQDYKSTTYQAGLGTYDGNNTHASYTYDIGRADTASNVSDAKDLKERRNQVVDYSDDNVMNHIAEVLASYREQPSYNGTKYNQTQVQSLVNELIDRTKMTAETGKIDIELEYNRDSTGDNKNDNQTSYSINNVDLGLEERPKAQLAIDKQVTNVKLTLADGSVLFDAKQTASNVLWQDHKKYDTGYSGNFMDASKFGTISNIRQQHATKFGLIQLSMDEELMHGATIKISYQITVTNVGEVDYKEDSFYYTGQISNTNNIVTTTANQLVDYVANNLQFYVADNSSWEVIESDKLLSDGLINTALKSNLEKFNTIITISANSNIAKTALVPSLYKEKVNKNAIDSVSDDLILTQLITSENDTDDLTYRNIVEIVKTSNMVGRKNEYSVVGNQNPAEDPQEIDTDRAEIVRILPPFGDAGIYYIIAGIIIVAVVIIIGGVIFIKKKILRKK